MTKRKILITGAGGGGSNNLIRSLRTSSLDLEICGSNLDPFILAKSKADENFILPPASEPNYIDDLLYRIQKERIDLVIPNNDREVRRISDEREKISCRLFLPPRDVVELCQDKFEMHLKLSAAGLSTAKSLPINDYDDIEPAIRVLADTGDRFWIRPRRGSGSKGATWVENAEQAKSWISLWAELRGYPVNTFTISEFLPGRDYAFQSIWYNGRLVVGKMCERLSYFFGANQLSGMSSTPAVARTVRDEHAIETALRTIHTICEYPHGIFNLDMKADSAGIMNVTECNIGRFFMITPIFDRSGEINTAETYVRCAFGEALDFREEIDIEEDIYLLRDLDTEPMVVSGRIIREIQGIQN